MENPDQSEKIPDRSSRFHPMRIIISVIIFGLPEKSVRFFHNENSVGKKICDTEIIGSQPEARSRGNFFGLIPGPDKRGL
jgi:hypothetical protein